MVLFWPSRLSFLIHGGEKKHADSNVKLLVAVRTRRLVAEWTLKLIIYHLHLMYICVGETVLVTGNRLWEWCCRCCSHVNIQHQTCSASVDGYTKTFFWTQTAKTQKTETMLYSGKNSEYKNFFAVVYICLLPPVYSFICCSLQVQEGFWAAAHSLLWYQSGCAAHSCWSTVWEFNWTEENRWENPELHKK